MSTVTCVAPVGDRCGEGVVWSAEERAVYWTDVVRFLVHRYDLDGASVRSWLFHERVVEMPVPNVTTCAFGGADLRTLFVATACRPSVRGDRLAGSLFRIETEVPGLPENRVTLA